MNISLIIPCYNEEANIQKGVLDKIGNYTVADARFLEVLIVSDGSTDSSNVIIKTEYLKRFPKFRLIENKHGGKAKAVITGINEAKGEITMFSDIDLATPIEEAEKLIAKAESGFDIVIGSRTTERAGAPFTRKLLAFGFITVRNLMIGLRGIRDTQCGFKLFESKLAKEIVTKLKVFNPEHEVEGSSVSAGFDLEFLFIASLLKAKIAEVTVIWRHVETKNVHFIKDAFETLSDIASIKVHQLRGEYNV